MSEFELAHLNVANLREPQHSPLMAGFVAQLARINALADAAAGFVWRWDEETTPGEANPLGELALINISVWRDVASLRAFVYRSAHAEVMARREQWFLPITEAFVALWWVPRGHRPGVPEALAKLRRLRDQGASAAAFGFAQTYPPPDKISPGSVPGEVRCP